MKRGEGRMMKKERECLRSVIQRRIDNLPSMYEGLYIEGSRDAYDLVLQDIDQLDESEVLSQEWISDHIIFNEKEDAEYIYADKLQNLIVPKQEELETKIQELIESYKQEEDAYSNPENGWISGFIEDLKNLVEKEQKYYILGKYDTPILFRDYRNRITETSNLNDIYPKANSEDFEFTEQEIKDYDERYWAFAEPVEEMEE